MFELSVGYVIGMISGYIVFRSSVVQAHEELKDYLDEYFKEVECYEPFYGKYPN